MKDINDARANENLGRVMRLMIALNEVNAGLRAQGYAPVVVSEEG